MYICVECKVGFEESTCPKCNQTKTVKLIPKRTPLGVKHYLEQEREPALINRLEQYPYV